MRGRLAAFAVVWQKREYRAFLIIMVLMSVGISATVPLTSLYLVNHFHLSLSLAGLFFAAQALPGLIIGLTVGSRSDRWHTRLPAIRLVSAWVAAGWVVFAFSPYSWLAFAVGPVFLSVGTIIMGQAFAALHDVMMRDREPNPGLINTAIRTGFSFGWMFGPLVGAALASIFNFRVAFIATACLSLLALAPLHGLHIPVVSARRGESGTGRPQSNLLLYLFVGLCALVLTGVGMKNAYLPIDVTTHLGGTVGTYGSIMAIAPVIELVALPGAGLLALRYPIGRLILLGLVLALAEYLILAFSSALWQLYVAQSMDALVTAVVMGLGMTYAQALSPAQAGLASSAFGSALGIGTVLGTSVGGATVSILGIPHVFFVTAAMVAIGLMIFVGVERSAAAGRRVTTAGSLEAQAQAG